MILNMRDISFLPFNLKKKLNKYDENNNNKKLIIFLIAVELKIFEIQPQHINWIKSKN